MGGCACGWGHGRRSVRYLHDRHVDHHHVLCGEGSCHGGRDGERRHDEGRAGHDGEKRHDAGTVDHDDEVARHHEVLDGVTAGHGEEETWSGHAPGEIRFCVGIGTQSVPGSCVEVWVVGSVPCVMAGAGCLSDGCGRERGSVRVCVSRGVRVSGGWQQDEEGEESRSGGGCAVVVMLSVVGDLHGDRTEEVAGALHGLSSLRLPSADGPLLSA